MVALFDIAPVERSLAPLLAHVYPGIDLTPTSRTPNSAKRAARIQELSALIEDFNTTIDVVGRLEDSVAQLMRELRRRRAAAEMALAPVTGLPNEVLEEVFLIVAANDTTSMAHIPISHVSSRWRVVSIGLKQLWTTILHPGLLHEYAERSKDLRLHFTPLPKARWPSDLEIAPAEASRLSTLLFRHSIHLGDKALGAPPERFVSSLERVGSQLALDRVEIAGVEGAFEQPAIAEYLRLEPTERDFVESVCKTKSFSGLALSNMAVSECGSWLLNAPSISQIQLHTIFGDNVAEHLAMDAQVVDDATDITPPRSCRKLKSLTMTRCCEDVYLPVIHDWLMPSLESLTLNLHEPGEACWSHRHYATFSESLLELFSHSVRLKTLDITCGSEKSDGLAEILKQKHGGDGFNVPLLRKFRICCPEEDLLLSRHEFVEAFESRARYRQGTVPLRQLTVSEYAVSDEWEETAEPRPYRALQFVLTVVDARSLNPA